MTEFEMVYSFLLDKLIAKVYIIKSIHSDKCTSHRDYKKAKNFEILRFFIIAR